MIRSLLLAAALAFVATPALAKKKDKEADKAADAKEAKAETKSSSKAKGPKKGRFCKKAEVGSKVKDADGNELECKAEGKRARWHAPGK